VEALANGVFLGNFDFEEYKGAVRKKSDSDAEARRPLAVTLVAGGEAARELKDPLGRARIVSDAQNFARTIASRPGNNISPPTLAKVAQDLAREVGLECRVLDEKQMQRLGMGGILAVGSGSIATPPRMIVLHWKGPGKGSRFRV